MKFAKFILGLACLLPCALVAQQAEVTRLMSKDLIGLAGKEGLMITVVYPPGSADPIHRHNAYGLRPGRLDRDAGSRRKASDSDTWSDLLRRPQ
jgi:hypothetical protein